MAAAPALGPAHQLEEERSTCARPPPGRGGSSPPARLDEPAAQRPCRRASGAGDRARPRRRGRRGRPPGSRPRPSPAGRGARPRARRRGRCPCRTRWSRRRSRACRPMNARCARVARSPGRGPRGRRRLASRGPPGAPPPPRRARGSARRRWRCRAPRPGRAERLGQQRVDCAVALARRRDLVRARARGSGARSRARSAACRARGRGAPGSRRARPGSRSRCRRARAAAAARRASAPICRYSGRKSWPHSLMQWASSIATRGTVELAQRAAEAREREALGRDVDELEAARARAREPLAHLVGGERRGEEGRRHARALRARCTWSCISETSGEMTRVVPREQRGRELVGEALAAAGRGHEQEAAALEQGLDRLALAGAEGRVAEPREAASRSSGI